MVSRDHQSNISDPTSCLKRSAHLTGNPFFGKAEPNLLGSNISPSFDGQKF